MMLTSNLLAFLLLFGCDRTYQRALIRYTESGGKKSTTIKPLEHKSYQRLNTKEKYAHCVLRICVLSSSKQNPKVSWLRYRALGLPKLPLELTDYGRQIFRLTYMKTSQIALLEAAVDTPADGGYGEGSEILFIRSILKTESPKMKPRKEIVLICRRLKREMMEEFHSEVMELLRKSPQTPFVVGLREALRS
jgi:hypothetical protein